MGVSHLVSRISKLGPNQGISGEKPATGEFWRSQEVRFKDSRVQTKILTHFLWSLC